MSTMLERLQRALEGRLRRRPLTAARAARSDGGTKFSSRKYGSGFFTAMLPAAALLAACGSSVPPPVDVPPPLVITVVVTPTGGGPDSGPTPGAGSTAPPVTPNAAYPPPFQNTLTAVYQDFERGFMLYLPDRKAIWVCIRSIGPSVNYGQWAAFPDTFQDGEPEIDPTLVPPTGLQQPKRGFGKVWRENPVMHDLIGWGLDFERAYATRVVDYSIGTFDASGVYTPRSFVHTIETPSGAVIHIDEATQLWSTP
jgi:hypothetical protein